MAYIIICGNITLESVTAFLDFLLQDMGNACTEILFLGVSLPSLELEAMFKCCSAYMTFFYGSALNSEDLKRLGVRTSFALSCRQRKYLKEKMLLEDKDKVMTCQLSSDFADMTFIEVCCLCFVKLILVLLETELKFGSQGERSFDGQEENSRGILDSTGMSHWCDAVPLHEALVSSKEQAEANLQDHIVCIFGDANSPLTGLQDFMMPLRASNFIYHELKDIVLLGSLEYLQEWKFIQNFPKLQYAVFRARALGNQSQPCYKRIPIITEMTLDPFARQYGQMFLSGFAFSVDLVTPFLLYSLFSVFTQANAGDGFHRVALFVVARPASDLKVQSMDLLSCVVPFNIATTDVL
ncbi:LOW QUALITY PROTEIN: potassium channel subfamily U member 1 [Pterocles gutturalis]